MRVTAVKVTVANLVESTRRAEIEVLVDTSRLYGRLPGQLLRSLGVEPLAQWVFQAKSGRPQEREIADVAVAYRGFHGSTRVIFGDPSDAPVLGQHALDSLGLRLDPETGELKPYVLPLYSCTSPSRRITSGASAAQAG